MILSLCFLVFLVVFERKKKKDEGMRELWALVLMGVLREVISGHSGSLFHSGGGADFLGSSRIHLRLNPRLNTRFSE